MLQNRFSDAKNRLDTVEKLLATARDPQQKTVAELFQQYQKRLRMNNSLDFDDLMTTTIELFRKFPEVLEFYQKKFHYIHVDEYQDTNQAQYMLCHLLAQGRRNLCVVGDSDQSIYSWRGADITNILNFSKDYPDATIIKLEQNYRSTNQILRAANQVIQHNSGRMDKKLWSERPAGEAIKVFGATSEKDEAYFVVNKIRHNVSQRRRYADHVVLYRTNAQSRSIEDVLKLSNIPYQIIGGMKFYDRKEIKDIIAYLRLLTNPTDDVSLLRILNVPKRGIGATTEEKLVRMATERGVALFELLRDVKSLDLPARTERALQEFHEMVDNLRAMQHFLTAHELTEKMLEMTELRREYWAENTIESQSRLENIDEFLSVTREFENRNADEDRSLVTFLTDLALIADIDSLNDQAGDGETADKDLVTLMTLHSAKGLEYPVVFMIGLEEQVFPHARSISDPEQMEEERRLCYVGITRAEDELYMTFAQVRQLYGGTQMNAPSRFLREIPEECIQLLKFQNQQAFGQRTGSGGGASGRVAPSSGKSMTSASNSASASASAGSTSVRPVAKPGAAGAGQSFTVGDKVSHAKWGAGVIVAVKGSGQDLELQVAFPSPTGIKRLLAQFAPLTKL
jgi:DNA helicase-2/ATP-dependent DNA helicase PcrA